MEDVVKFVTFTELGPNFSVFLQFYEVMTTIIKVSNLTKKKIKQR